MQHPRGRSVLLALLVAFTATTASATSQWNNDAGTGADAGDDRVDATPVALATTYGGAFLANDADWYEASATEAGPTCIVATMRSSTPAYFALGVESDGTTTTAPVVSDGREVLAGIAAATPLAATLRVRDVPSDSHSGFYEFRLARVGLSAAGDGGTAGDAGDTPSNAMNASAGCTAGHLTALQVDMYDVYRIDVAEGEVVTYSLSSSVPGIELSLVNALGEIVGPVIGAGGHATADGVAPGTYYMSASRGNALGAVGYVIGAVIGPEPVGCKPYCLDS